MSKQFRVVNFDPTNIIELINQGHSAFTKGKNGKKKNLCKHTCRR